MTQYVAATGSNVVLNTGGGVIAVGSGGGGTPAAPTNVGVIATAIATPVSTTSAVTNYIDWTASVTSGVTNYKVYANGTYIGSTGSGSTLNYTDSATQTANQKKPKYTVSAVNASGEGAQSGAMIAYQYHESIGVLNAFASYHCSAEIAHDLDAGMTPTDNAANAQSGRSYCLELTGSSYPEWQPAATFYDGISPSNYGYGPFGFNLLPFVALTFAIKPTSTSYNYYMHMEYPGLYSGSNDIQANVTLSAQGGWGQVPGFPTLTANVWNTGIQIPLAFFGLMQNPALYKFYIQPQTSGTATFYMDDVGFVTGSTLMIHDGGAPTTYGNTSCSLADEAGLCWNHNASTLLNGFVDSSTATYNYSFSPTTLTNLNFTPSSSGNGCGSANGLLNPGINATPNAPTNVISLSGTNAYWQVINSSGVSLANYDHIALALLPTSSTRSWTLQAVNASGTLVGNSVTLPGSYTNYDFGPGTGANTTYWTVCVVPISAIGVSGTLYGLRLTDTSGVSSNTYYLSAPCLYGVN